MPEEPARGRGPTATDAALALAVLGLRAGLRVGRAVTHALAPVGVLCVERRPCRRLAEAGAGYRRAAVAAAARRYRAVVAVVATDVADELDLPRLVRDATGSVLSETGHGVRRQARRADDAVTRWVDRTLRRDDR
jgi:hypothetical protein